MKEFTHFNASTLDEAVSLLSRYGRKASIIAGGTDLLGKMKDEILPTYPEAVINIKTIPGMEYVREENQILKIGALTRLEDIAHHPIVKAKFSALAQAASKTASPHIREMGTIGGNIVQDIRCWYYRSPNNRFPCLRKGGGRCYSIEGDNRYHSILGGSVDGGCYAVHPSDTAPALIALDARVKTTKRTINAEDFFQVAVTKTTVLDDDEIVAEIQIPEPATYSRSAFIKFALRKTIDFSIVNCASMVTYSKDRVQVARICLNAVYVKPYRAFRAEEVITGEILNETSAEAAGSAAISQAKPLQHNGYMAQIARTMVKRSLLACCA